MKTMEYLPLLVMVFVMKECSLAQERPDWDSWLRPSKPRCEILKINLCKNEFYNMTIVPNSLGHRSQDEAALEISNFSPLIRVRCSPYFQQFLCLLYAPVCTVLDKPILPCRSLCKKARRGCIELMQKFGFKWPEVLKCSKFPRRRDGTICSGVTKSKRQKNKKGKKKDKSRKKGNKKDRRKKRKERKLKRKGQKLSNGRRKPSLG